jgi:hypothetical protein
MLLWPTLASVLADVCNEPRYACFELLILSEPQIMQRIASPTGIFQVQLRYRFFLNSTEKLIWRKYIGQSA